MRAVITTVVPEASTLDDGAWAEVQTIIGATLAKRDPMVRRQLALFLRFIQWAPVIRYGRRFTVLSAMDRARFLGSLQDYPASLVRIGFWGVRTLALLGYYGRPGAARDVGYLSDARGWEAQHRTQAAP